MIGLKVRGLVTALSVGLVFALIPATAQARETDSQDIDQIIATPTVELAPDANHADPVLQSEVRRLAVQARKETSDSIKADREAASGQRAFSSAPGFSLTYDGTPPPSSVRTVLQQAINNWGASLDTSAGPINVEVTWRSFGNASILGSAGPTTLHPVGGAYVPVALRNTQTGSDNNGASVPEIVVDLNSQVNWYVGSGTPSSNQIDLHSAVLHELGHGLGFVGRATHNGSALTYPSPGSSYDRQVRVNGTVVLDTANPVSHLTSNNLRVDSGANHSHKVFAPSTWAQGSSLSHLDESTYPAGTAGALMTPTIFAAETNRVLDGPTLGIMAQLGWPLKVLPLQPKITSVSSTSNPVVVNWQGQHHNNGYIPDIYRVQLIQGSTVLQTKEVVSTVASTSFSSVPSGPTTIRITPVDEQSGSNEVTGNAAQWTGTVSGAGPDQVRYVQITDADGTICSASRCTVSWPASSGASNYRAEKSVDGGAWTTIGTTSNTSFRHTFSEGTQHVRITPQNSSGAGVPNTSIPSPIGTTFVRPAALDHRIERLYLAAFLRGSDEAGFVHWRDQHARTMNHFQLGERFAVSQEFHNRYGSLNNTQFVELLYNNIFNRSLDPVGRATWVPFLDNGGSRGEFLSRAANSNEFIQTTGTEPASNTNEGSIYRLYLAAFKRLPDNAGYAHWVSELNGGTTLNYISSRFVISQEFQQTYGSVSNTDFVDLMYNNVLSRDPDATGRAQWVGRLNAGMSRGDVLMRFAESAEFVIATGSSR